MSVKDFRISRAAVTGFADEELCWAVVDPVWPDNQELDELAHIRSITPGQRAMYTTMLYAREVDNGGIEQFLSNSSGIYLEAVLEGLDLLGARELYAALKQVLGYLPDANPSSDWEARRRAVAAFSSDQRTKIQTHENAVFQRGGFESSLLPHWIKYIQEHSSDFFIEDEETQLDL